MIQTQPSLEDLNNKQCHDGFASWYKNDVALMESCRAGTSCNYDNMPIKSASLLLTTSSMLSTASRVTHIFPSYARVIANKDSISNFLTTPYFDNLVRETGGQSQEGSVSISLIDSVMAFGYQAYLTVSQRFISTEEKKKAQYYSRIALRSRGSVLLSSNTLLKLQASRSP